MVLKDSSLKKTYFQMVLKDAVFLKNKLFGTIGKKI